MACQWPPRHKIVKSTFQSTPKFCDFESNQVFGKFKQPPLPTATTLVVAHTTSSPLASSDSELTSLSLFLQFRFHPQLASLPPRCSVQVVTLNCPVQPTLNSQKLEGGLLLPTGRGSHLSTLSPSTEYYSILNILNILNILSIL